MKAFALALVAPLILTLSAASAHALQSLAEVQTSLVVSDDQAVRCSDYGLDELKLKDAYRLVTRYAAGPLVALAPSKDLRLTAYERSQATDASQLASQEIFVQPAMRDFLNQLATTVKSQLGVALTVTATTRSSAYDGDSHCGHADGLAADVRPMPGVAPTSWFDATYNRALNKKFILLLIANPSVKKVFFNDPRLLGDADIDQAIVNRQSATGDGFSFSSYDHKYQNAQGQTVEVSHDNHIHVEIKPDAAILKQTQNLMTQAGS
jgi:hypothetical protein